MRKLLQRMAAGFRPTPPTHEPAVLIQYGRMAGGQVVATYPTEAAMNNDPAWGRNGAGRSVARAGQLGADGARYWSEWRPVFNGDLATHRYRTED